MPQRQGKIARLPFALREELNRRLLDGEAASKILPWLNNLPVVGKILGEDFEGLAINDGNLSDWRKGGYADWLKRRDRLDHTRELAGVSIKLAKASGGNLSEGASAILAGELMDVFEQMQSIREQLTAADASPEKLTALGGLMESLTASLNSIRSGDHSQKTIEQNERKLQQNERRLAQTDERIRLMKEAFLVRTLNAAVMNKVQAVSQDKSLDNAQKISALRKIYFEDVDALEKSGDVKLPD